MSEECGISKKKGLPHRGSPFCYAVGSDQVQLGLGVEQVDQLGTEGEGDLGAVGDAAALGIDTILTSGGAGSCLKGMETIRQLIALRHAHPALENRSDIEFISNGAPKQALAYVRSCEEEKLLVVINPYKEPVKVSFTGEIGESIYHFGGKVSQKNREVTVPAISAGIYKVI